MMVTNDQLEAMIHKVDGHHAEQAQANYKFFKERTDTLTNDVQFLRAQIAELYSRLERLERR